MGKTQALPTDAEDAPTIARMSVRERPVEVITRGERRRVWTDAQKHDIVLESLVPGGSPVAVARRHGIGTGLLYTWRRQLVEGQLKALMPAAPSFVPVAALPDDQAVAAERTSPWAAPLAAAMDGVSGWIEIMLPDGVTVRVGAAVEEEALRRVLAALGRR
jgi:transposase